YGRIRDEQGREYKFLLTDLLDPSVRPELESSFTTRFDLPVTFLPHMRLGSGCTLPAASAARCPCPRASWPA
ncbi:MAG: hypothetical protein IJ484_05930, partial [Oscillospiraceae bacterium]|nr:hypothetical protein [Oscillospiraceae bacterium]